MFQMVVSPTGSYVKNSYKPIDKNSWYNYSFAAIKLDLALQTSCNQALKSVT
ncbi:hypothetical protein SERLADRAFT_374478 [Serpula lacrymans var. lacrymans S7.9]|uniref:Uncharacterized protein n=1 Tax=Serpula lacrymans var. lacrymans (strain S7.9) TaxID=578457 RepID=F8PBZ3_SERL9|nr:uncharacterized protein SERLADRAFT_374478 [Serpula lacrymans var. lacrymans S7.9]EGO19196.1 hypothetical protein SERLADRAFT_374478 [Serpula lacrymans var. lacrymans S7.9]